VDRSVTFAATDPEQDGEPSLVNQLFRTQRDSLEKLSWDQTILDFTKSTVRTGLPNELRTQLLSKFEIKEALLILGPPKLNRMLLSVLKASSTVSKRDEYQSLAQSQRIINRLSLARRVFIKPALNLLGKSTADLAPIDEWLFGTSFVDEVKDAQACEKVARVLARAPAATSKVLPQSVGKVQLARKQVWSGNAKGPARQSNQPYRRAGTYQSKNRPRRSLSRSRAHRR
ncbi:hypothetical protein ALC60_06316, partial [Trachymyrmex zeteki]